MFRAPEKQNCFLAGRRKYSALLRKVDTATELIFFFFSSLVPSFSFLSYLPMPRYLSIVPLVDISALLSPKLGLSVLNPTHRFPTEATFEMYPGKACGTSKQASKHQQPANTGSGRRYPVPREQTALPSVLAGNVYFLAVLFFTSQIAAEAAETCSPTD